MARKVFGQRSRFKSTKRNLSKKIMLFRSSGTGDPSVFSSSDEKEDLGQPFSYNPHAYSVIDKRLREIEAQKAMALARTQRLTF